MVATLIVNPVSGGGRAQSHVESVLAALRARFGTVDLVRTGARGDGRHKAGRACDEGTDFIIAMGGDGTISECASGILSSTRPGTPLSVIPAGTGSDFSKIFRQAGNPVEWVERITFPQCHAIDAGLVRIGHDQVLHVVNIASFGISGIIADRVNLGTRPRLVSGKMWFLLRSLVEIARFKPVRVELSIDGGEAVERDIALIAIANTPLFGGGMKVAPDAKSDDGLFDVVIVKSMSAVRLLAEFPSIYSGRHVTHAAVEVVRARRLQARLLGGQGAIEVDGESVGHLPVDITIMPSCLRLAMEMATPEPPFL